VVVLTFVAGVAVTLLRIRADLEGGRDALAGLSLERLDGGLEATVDRAADRLESADARSDSIFLAPLAALPVVGDQVDALRDLTAVTARIGRTGRTAANAIGEDLERASGDPSARIDLLETISEQLDLLETEVADIEVGAEGRLIGPLKTARSKLIDEIDRVPERFDEARGYIEALSRLLQGPTRYLVLAANNAEMRGGAGMPLSGGVVTFANGDVSFGSFESLANRHVAGTPELIPEPWLQTYEGYLMGRSWLQTALSPSFPTTAEIYAAMSAQFPLGPVEGVIEVDALALSALLKVIGPVDFNGETYTAENIASKVLHENYLEYDTLEEREARQSEQGQLAAAIFEALKTRDVEVADLAIGLREAARGRHLLAWAADPGIQELWDTVGATGELPVTGLMVTVQNRAANKLDWFIDPRVTMAAFPELGTEAWRVRLTVTIENPEVEDTNDYIDGVDPNFTDGTHRALVGIYLPAQAYGVRALDEPITRQGGDPPLQMYGTNIIIPRGETKSFALEFTMPRDQIGAVILPSGRVRPVAYEVNGVEVTDAVATPVFWIQPPGPEETPGAAAVAGLLALGGAFAVAIGLRPRLRTEVPRPLKAVPDVITRAPAFGVVLYLAALGALIAGALISAAST
jgi:hypothetical protein